MGTALHTFIDIFSAAFPVEEENVTVQKIVIPIIQRDYAQGRKDTDVARIRDRFLNSLRAAVTEAPITLDFVYGDIDSNGVMTPLDGQQRLTTLFLLHWYAAKRGEVAEEEYAFLNNFSYETRYSARDFCDCLIRKYTPSFNQQISEEIVDQAWFPLDWEKDPTINSMLVMLDAIDAKFSDVPNVWSKLRDGAISFYFLPIKDMGLTDELYIKMNSRGKPLTQFEHFKAELEHSLRLVDETTAKRILRKIDIDWTDMLWFYRGEDNIIDDEFLRYFRFVCDIICYQAGGTTQGKSDNEFDLLKEYFSPEAENVMLNITKLESYFDCWCSLGDVTPTDFLLKFISYEHEAGKIQIETRYALDIFEDCLRTYADIAGNGNRSFPLGRIILLFAFVTYLEHRTDVSETDFARRLRIVNNLIQNSEDEISDSERRTSGNRMPTILRQVEEIILTGVVDAAFEKSMNPSQLQEEAEKLEWLEAHPEYAEDLFALEDHELLQGQIGIVGLENPEQFARFGSLFDCDWDKVDCALMSIGFYGQKERNGWRYQLGTSSRRNTKAWRALFHRSRNNSGFDETKRILKVLLASKEDFSDEYLDFIKEAFIKGCEQDKLYPWRYYYVKYDFFRPGSYGKYSWDSVEETPYLFSVMMTETKWSENTYQPFLRAIDESRLSRDEMGQYLLCGDKYMEALNDGYSICDMAREEEEDAEIYRITVTQNEDGIDTENRIEKMMKIYPNI